MASPSSRYPSNDENRYRFQNTSLGTSRRHAPREASRRMSHVTPAIPHSRTFGLGQDVDMVEPSTQMPSGHYSALPRELRRPTFRPISSAALAVLDPCLTDIPATFVRHQLHNQRKELFTNACQAVTKAPKGRVPREIDVVINNTSAYPPTHVVAVYSLPSASQKQRVTLHPIHGLVLAANCAHLPPLPYSGPEVPDHPGFIVTLPVIPIAIKSPETFSGLVEYLYTQNTDRLLRSLLPVSTFRDIPAPAKLARELARTCTPTTLQAHLYRIHGLWNNVTALGVSDRGLWQTMELAWEVLQDAIA